MSTPEPRKKNPVTPEAATRRHLRAWLRWRGWFKVVLMTIVADQLLTSIFTVATQYQAPGIGETPTLIFSCVTCMLVSHWLVTDARAAWSSAKQNGLIGTAMDAAKGANVVIAAHCPKRWLVVLHLELNPELALPD